MQIEATTLSSETELHGRGGKGLFLEAKDLPVFVYFHNKSCKIKTFISQKIPTFFS